MSRWRLSSPLQQISLGPNLPVFRALAPDWSQGWTASRAAVVRGQKQEIVGNISCSEGREIYVSKAGQNKGCSGKKYLHEDGKITENKCVKTSCTKHGLPCHPDTIDKIDAECHGQLQSPLFIIRLNSFGTPRNLSFVKKRTRDYCCIDSSNYLQFFGNDCLDIKFSNISKICKFSERFEIQPCLNIGQQKISTYCAPPNRDCVISSTSLSICEKTTPVAHFCDIDDLNCKMYEMK